MTCRNLDFGRPKLHLVACSFSSSDSIHRYSVRNYAKSVSKSCNRDYGFRRMVCCRRDIARCRVSSTKTPQALLARVAEGPTGLLNLKKESREPVSLTNLFEVVADDLLNLKKNLRSIDAAENMVLMSAAEQIFGAGGKRMRPALVFLLSRATVEVVGDLTTEHQRLAEIIEMIHTASLIHDDLLDESGMRRGKETYWLGEFMFAQSSWYLANLENIELIKLISSVGLQLHSVYPSIYSPVSDITLEFLHYAIYYLILKNSYYKTASLIAASTKGAAIFSGVDSNVCVLIYEYGKNLGLSFQVVDDILDFTQSAKLPGKPAGSDLAKGNLTAPVIFALEQSPKLREIIETEFRVSVSLDEATELVMDCGGIERAQELAKERADLAIQNLRSLPRGSYQPALEEMVLCNLERVH
ncbi:hypothetical protein POPTR_011G101301v4 [Populus trichocarpa]|uniref:Uncharacterized protein n=1 Tax=Populus trichocarpa TaxID=3694 RepID=A0ACC0S9E0_POPTR|nr:hypothetical protein POPTR_011G101301v4 [Populus trichocarpa]